jgi:hypothetical protein
VTGETPGDNFCCETAETSSVCQQDSLNSFSADFADNSGWYVVCFSNGMKMNRSTPKELTEHFSPVTPQRVNESPIMIPLAKYWAQA